MNLLEMKKKVLRLIEEVSTSDTKLTDDPDIENKLNDVINQITFEVARIKKIPAIKTVDITADRRELKLKTLPKFYQLAKITAVNSDGEPADFDIFGNIAEFEEDCKAKIKYYKYPERIFDDTDDEMYEFELSDDVLEIIPYGVAGDLLKSDISNQFGRIYSDRYNELLNQLDPRYSTEMITIGCDY